MTSNELLHASSNFMTLNQLGAIQVEGEDAQSMLQNLLTNDVAALAINQSHLSGLCNPKGRLLAIFLLLRRSNGYLLILPKAMCAGLQQRLSMYILRSKVTITDASDNVKCIGLTLANDGIINSRELPEVDFQATEHDDSVLIKYPGSQPRFLCVGSPGQLTTFTAELLEQQWHSATESDWELLDIAAGLPMIQPSTKEQFTTQQVNLDLVNGVSFKKGCYPGQEIVARLHYLGTPSRRMFQAEVHTANPVNVGDEVTSEEGNVAGHVVRVQQKNDGSLLMLVSLKLSAIDLGVFVHNNEQVKIIGSVIVE